MNLGNLINKKIVKSKYENKKELYESMKEIIGDDCCAYNTFTEALSKNKSLSDKELLVLSVLLDLDLNKLALHYIKSQKSNLIDMSVEEYIRQNKSGILLFISYLLGNKYESRKSEKTMLHHIDNKIYFLSLSKNYNKVICYEFNIKKNSRGYLLKTNEIANFSYFKSILSENDLSIDEFMKFNFSKMIEIVKNEVDIYYDLYPDKKPEIIDIYLDEFKNNILRESIVEYIEKHKCDMTRTNKNEFYECDIDVYGDEYIDYVIDDIIEKKNLYPNGILEMRKEAHAIFKEEGIKRVPVYNEEECNSEK